MPILRDVFISHSRHDRKAVEKLVSRLDGKVDIYVDLNDPLLADSPSEHIASRLLEELQYSRVLLVVLSVKSMGSRWIPWELGLAHGRIGRVLLWPLSPSALKALKVQEYLHLYPVVDPSDPLSSLQSYVEQARQELMPDAFKEAFRIAGAYAADASHHLKPVELPGATAEVATDASANFSMGTVGRRRK